MNDYEGVAPAVTSILETARSRPGGDTRRTVDPRPLTTAFTTTERNGNTPIIAEIKPTSPTTDGTDPRDPIALADAMVAGGASAISVLTEPDHFGGSPALLRRVREHVDVPVLRKDFLLTPAHLDTVAADAVLLIARFLDDVETMLQEARVRGFQPLVEVHTIPELETALEAGADIIGINNRNLTDLTVDLTTFERLAPQVPKDITLIAESGVSEPADITRFRDAGADAVLVGTTIMDAEDITARTESLVNT